MDEQPAYYRLVDPLENLRVRVRLRKIHAPTPESLAERSRKRHRPKHRSDQHKSADVKAKDTQPPSPSILKVGQETEMVVKWQDKVLGPRELVVYSEEFRDQRRPRAGLRSVDYEYEKHVADMGARGMQPLDLLSEVMLFTYTDKDGFVPRSEVDRRLTDTLEPPPQSHLDQAVLHLPRRSGEATGGLTDTARAAQAHLTREAKVKVMYVMAALDVDVEDMRAGNLNLHERVLCSVRAHSNGVLEVRPGFSQEEPESGDDGPHPTDRSLAVMEQQGPRLTSFRFSTPSGCTFEYTVENAAEVSGGQEQAEELAQEQAEKDRKGVLDRRQQTSSAAPFLSAPPSEFSCCIHVFMEIVSASGFAGQEIYLDWQLALPDGWRPSPQHSMGPEWEQDGDGGFSAGGTTQVSRATPYVPRLLHRPASGGTGGLRRATLPLGPQDQPPRPWQRALAVLLLLLLAASFLFGLSAVFWVALAVCLLVAAALGGAGGALEAEPAPPVAHFSLPVELHLLAKEPPGMEGLMARPQVLLQVSSVHSFERQRLEGYGHLLLPRAAGAHEFEVRTWKPWSGVRAAVRDFYIGGANRLRDPAYAGITPCSPGGAYLSRFGFRTQNSGSVRIRLHLAEQGRFVEQRVAPAPNRAVDTRSVQEILRTVNARRLSAAGTGAPPSPAQQSEAAIRLRAALAKKRAQEGGGAMHQGTSDADVGGAAAGGDLLGRVRRQLELSRQRIHQHT